MFRTFKPGTTLFFETAIEEWCKANKVSRTTILTSVSDLSDEDKELVVAVYNHPKTVATLHSVVTNIAELREKVKRGAKELHIVASPIGNIPPTFGYKL